VTPRRTASPALAPLWRVEDVATYLRVPVNTIYKWRRTGEGPPCFRVGKYLRFDPDDVRRWVDTRRDTDT